MQVVYKELTCDGAKSNVVKWNLVGLVPFMWKIAGYSCSALMRYILIGLFILYSWGQNCQSLFVTIAQNQKRYCSFDMKYTCIVHCLFDEKKSCIYLIYIYSKIQYFMDFLDFIRLWKLKVDFYSGEFFLLLLDRNFFIFVCFKCVYGFSQGQKSLYNTAVYVSDKYFTHCLTRFPLEGQLLKTYENTVK